MFQISPPKPIGKSVIASKEESSIPVYLVLGAFAAIPKIHFEAVKMGQSRKRTLIVRNPSDQVAWLKLVKKPSAAFHLNWEIDPQIEPNGQCVLDITWTPTEEGQCFQAFQLQSSLTGIKFSVHLLGVCSSPPKRNFRSRPVVSSRNIQTNSSRIKTPGPGTETTVVTTSGTREKLDHNLSDGVSNISSQPSGTVNPVDGYELEEDLRKELSGDFANMIVSVCQGARHEDDQVDEARAREDAQKLMETSELKFGTDESTFTSVLVRNGYAQLLAVEKAYQEISKKTLEESISSELSGNLLHAANTILGMAKNKDEYFAKRLQSTMAGLGTDDKALINIIVLRSEIDLGNIMQAYEKLYEETLAAAIESETSGDYKKLLLDLLA